MPTNADLELQERIGRGSMAEVWKAFDPQSQSYVAVKMFHPDLLNDPDFMTFYQSLPGLREAKLIVSLRHPNIVRVHDFDFTPASESEDALAYIVMDYIEGPTLADYLCDTSARQVFPSASEAAGLLAPMAAPLDYAHEQGVIHGDLKPSNILLDQHNTARHPMGEPMLTDFGLRSLLERSTAAQGRREHALPYYLSPEQAQGQPATERSDLYALGVILYELCTGTRPFQSHNPALLRQAHIQGQPPAPTQVNPKLSPAVSAVILRSLAKDPAQRFLSATDLVSALAEGLSQPASVTDMANGQITLPAIASPQPAEWLSSTNGSAAHEAAPASTEEDPTTIKVGRTPAAFSFLPPSLSQSSSTAPSHAPDVPAIPPSETPGEEERPAESQAASLAFSPSEWLSTPQPTASAPPPPAAPSAPPEQPISPPPWAPKRRSLGKPARIALLAILLLLLASTLGALVLLPHRQATTTTPPALPSIAVVGHVYFLSSGQLYVNNNQGIYDQVLLDLHHLATPSPGKSYYAWLLGDTNQSDVLSLALGQLSVSQGNVHFLYPGDQMHSNLLIDFSRLLITQEDATAPSANPLLAPQTWRYYGQIYQLPSPKDANHFSMLDHLRHLLVQAPELQVLGLPGGLSIWLLRNVEEILRWSVEAKDRFLNTAAVRGLLSSILYYLDGECTPADLQGAPAGTPLTPGNATIAQIARFSLINPCLQEQQEQVDVLKQVFRATPHDYVDHTLFHLTGVVQSPGTTSDQSALATQLNRAVTDLKAVLERLRQDALQLVHMSNEQLHQSAAFALVGDMALQARYAYAGQTDPITGNNQEGALWIYNNVQRLATFDVMPYAAK